MRIGIDTLFEHPENPSSAIDYVVAMSEWLPRVAPEHHYDLFVSPRNRFRFQHLERDNVQLVNCVVSNEVISLRILAQQTVLAARAIMRETDLLFAPGNVCPMAGNFCRVLKINSFHHIHTPDKIGWTRSLYRRVAFQWSSQRADLILANSSVTQKDLCLLLDVPEEKVALVWEAVDDLYQPATAEQMGLTRERFGLKRPFILFVSTLYPYKNPDGLIQAIAQLAVESKLLDHDLVIVGRDWGGSQAKLETMVKELGLGERTHFFGFLPSDVMPALYSAARVFVYPSLLETFGKPLVEAMRCGVPVVASNTGSIPEVSEQAALLINPNDVRELAAAVYRAATDEPLRRDLICRGIRRGGFFSWESHAKLTAEAMQRAFIDWKRRRA